MYTHICLPHKQISADLVAQQPCSCELDITNIKTGREYLSFLEERLVNFFNEGYSIAALLDYRTHYVDEMMRSLYEHFELNNLPKLAMIAVGGYGRGELFLKSDIDLLIVSQDKLSEEAQEQISSFISYLWDLKLDIGSSVRTIDECLEKVNADLTICTNLLENRFLCGDYKVYEFLLNTISKDSTWNTKRFFHAKVAEELERHHAYKDTSYALEPDLKQNPGGIRDIHVMQWIANFHFQAKTPEDMLNLGFLSQEEYEELIESRDVLYQVRYALHVCTRREDNRLSLDCQPSVAQLLGYVGNSNEQVETMMRDLYRTLRRIRELNSMALQLEVLRITGHLGDDETQFINNDFIRRGPLIDVTSRDVFENDKSKMLEIFYLMAKHPEVVGLHVNALRLLRRTRRSLTNYLVEIPECRTIFKSILDDPKAASTAFPLMHEHRILSAYMPSWEKIEGLSQFDMFHLYTVDEHTIRVIKNFESLSHSKDQSFTLFKHVYSQLSNPEILVVAGLLHDIAKGQGGHHAQLGAGEALYFCQLHRYTLYQTRLVSWLVYNHLMMSSTAQRRDINDPQVVNEFSKKVQDEEHLNLLYCLSVADICATNDREWNSWKDIVFKQLYFSTRQALRHGLEMPHDIKLHANENQELAIKYMRDLNEQDIRTYWSYFKPEYFIYYTPQEIAWHTRNILTFRVEDHPLILFAQHKNTATEMLIFFREHNPKFNFAYLAYIMAQKRLSIQSAQFIRNKLNQSICTLKFQSQMGGCIDNERLHSIRMAIIKGINEEPSLERIAKLRDNSKKQIFKIPTGVNYLEDHTNEATNLEISALDQPGLLAKIGIIFDKFNLLVRSSRITTTGERADDFFSVTDRQGRPLSERTKDKLEQALIEALDPPKAEQSKRQSQELKARRLKASSSEPRALSQGSDTEAQHLGSAPGLMVDLILKSTLCQTKSLSKEYFFAL